MWQHFTESNNDFYFPENHGAYQEIKKYVLEETAAMIVSGQGFLMGYINANTSN